MARPFTKEEAKELIDVHLNALAMEDVYLRFANRPEKIQFAVEKYRNALVKEYLKGISISELNKISSDIPLKILETSGYTNLSDFDGCDEKTLSSLVGVGEEIAKRVIESYLKCKNDFLRVLKVRLNYDDRNSSSTLVLKSLYFQINGLDLSQKCRDYCVDKKTEVLEAIGIIKQFQDKAWLLIPRKDKERVINAFNKLRNLANVINLYSFCELEKILNVSDDDIWDDFSKHTQDYIITLEKNQPLFVGRVEISGLPEELAKKISEQQVFTEGLRCELRNYQELGVKYALHQERIILGDEMGLGKTVQAIATMVSLRCTGATHFVVVCPASVITNWCREIMTKSTLDVIKVHGNDKESSFRRWLKEGGVAVTTYETTGIFDFGEDTEFKFSEIIVDEAHYIKNPSAKRTINVKNICQRAERIMFMTGTALENKVEEMIELISILDPDISNKLRPMSFMSAAPEFRNIVAPVYYRRRREDVLTELPEKIESKEWCTLLPEEEKIYEKSVLEGKYTESRRVSWNAPDLSQSSKAQRLLELIKEAEEEERKIIVFSFFLDTMNRVVELLGDKCMPIINGSVPPSRRQQIVDDFEKAPAGTVLPAQIQAGGTGLNIQSASVVIILEPQFKPSIENQAISRAYRMGQARNVLVYRLLCDNTIDEKISELLEEKQGIFDAFADESEAGKEIFELSDKTFGTLIQEEIERIKNKQEGAVVPNANTPLE